MTQHTVHDALLPAILRPNGESYRPRKLTAVLWHDGPYHAPIQRGVYVYGTHDIAVAYPLAAEMVQREFGPELNAIWPDRCWVGKRPARNSKSFVLIRDDMHGRAAVRWTAEAGHELWRLDTMDSSGAVEFVPSGDMCSACSDPARGHWIPAAQCSEATEALNLYRAWLRERDERAEEDEIVSRALPIGWIWARFAGLCVSCDQPTEIGDLVRCSGLDPRIGYIAWPDTHGVRRATCTSSSAGCG